MTNVKGSKIISKLAFVRELSGEEGVTKLVESLSPADRASARALLEFNWYPQELYDRVVEAICHVFANGDPAIYERIGRHSAEHQLAGSYKASRAGSLESTLKNQARVHSMLNDPGAMQVELPRPGECRIVVTAPKSTAATCAIARAWYKRIIELHGATDVHVLEPHCTASGDAECEFRISWRT